MSEAQEIRAWRRAQACYASPQFQRAYVKGARAALRGLTADACPYRNRHGWRAWRTAWLRGYRSALL
jgi:ribosome modulation factor